MTPAPIEGPPDRQRRNPDTNVSEPVVATDTREGRAYTPTKDEICGANQEDQQQTKETGSQDQRLGDYFDPRLLRNPTSNYERTLRLYLTGNAEVTPLTDQELIEVNEKEARRPRNTDPNSDLTTINDNLDKKLEHMKRFCRAVEARHAREEAARQAAASEPVKRKTSRLVSSLAYIPSMWRSDRSRSPVDHPNRTFSTDYGMFSPRTSEQGVTYNPFPNNVELEAGGSNSSTESPFSNNPDPATDENNPPQRSLWDWNPPSSPSYPADLPSPPSSSYSVSVDDYSSTLSSDADSAVTDVTASDDNEPPQRSEWNWDPQSPPSPS